METEIEDSKVVEDAEVMPSESQELEIVADTVTQLARRGTEGKAIIKAREEIVDTAVRASIRLTHPQDWVLFKDKNTGRVTAYLQESGCRRIDRIWGIQVTPKPGYEKIEEGGEFTITVSGDAYCKLTDTWINDIDGTRSSEEKFAEQASSPLKKVKLVHQAAKANLCGNAIRRLSGLQSIPEAFLNECWKGTNKTSKDCSLGRGFGSQQERQGTDVRSEHAPANIQPPICDSCGASLKYVPGGKNANGKWEAYWKCAQYAWDSKERKGNGHSRVMAAEWEKLMAAAAQKEAEEPPEQVAQ